MQRASKIELQPPTHRWVLMYQIAQVTYFLERLCEGDKKHFMQQVSATGSAPVCLYSFCKKVIADKDAADAAEVAQAAWAKADEVHEKFKNASAVLREAKIAVEEMRKEWIQLTESASTLQNVADSLAQKQEPVD